MIFAKRSMKNKAKLLLASDQKILTYDKFKDVMLNEFGASANSTKIHDMLSTWKMRGDETIDE